MAEPAGQGCMPPRDWPRAPRARLSHCRRHPGWRGGRTEGCRGWRAPGNMAEADLAQIPDVDIDPDGVFKYVLIRVRAAAPSEAPAGDSKDIVRGYKWAEYHGEGGAEDWGRGRCVCGRAMGRRGRGSRAGPGVRGVQRLPWPDPSLLVPRACSSVPSPPPRLGGSQSWGFGPLAKGSQS